MACRCESLKYAGKAITAESLGIEISNPDRVIYPKDGITKVRGRSYPFRGGLLIPTFHPAAILRGGAQQMAQMRADLVRAKQAMAPAGPEVDVEVPPPVAPASADATLFD